MGSNFAHDLANNELLELDLERQIGIHLSANHYPPVPSSMIQPCIDAIDAYYDDERLTAFSIMPNLDVFQIAKHKVIAQAIQRSVC